MIEKPDLPDEKITASLQAGYDITAARLDFLPLGNDATAWVYSVRAIDGRIFFLKVKKGSLYEPSVTVPRFLREQGIVQVVAPLATKNQRLWESVESYSLILYPFIDGRMGMETGLTDAQWAEFGSVLQKIHSTRPPAPLLGQVERETFHPKWSGMVNRLQAKISAWEYSTTNVYPSSFEKELAAFWKDQADEIRRIVERAEALGQRLRDNLPEFVLCHTDIHTANILLDKEGGMHIVDWDQPLLAPKERDLMFVVGAAGEKVTTETSAQRQFFSGYGKVDIDPVALTYYQYEWAVQEIGDFGERVFLMDDLGLETKKASVEGFMQLFQPGDVIETAYNTDQTYFHLGTPSWLI